MTQDIVMTVMEKKAAETINNIVRHQATYFADQVLYFMSINQILGESPDPSFLPIHPKFLIIHPKGVVIN
jgi:hypothetical protein